MPDISELRALLRDRQQKEQTPTLSYEICLDDQAVTDYRTLKAERDDLDDQDEKKPGDNRLGAPKKTALDKQLAELETKIKNATLRLEFRALTAAKYQELLDQHPKANEGGKDFAAFIEDLAETCFKGCWRDGEKEQIKLAEVREGLTFGEWEPIPTEVLALNRRKVDIPFSNKQSKRIRR